ncbi:ankyrin repeat and KH domain-containing protein mask-like isoform X2 [Sycon ciliatum]|uniref:ankyrin repeat and KH domain-containing protein mask-like isoform X2 n=1 Tax=Sycon ciliatum TaxID=27933 RepID=UPI0031F70E76
MDKTLCAVCNRAKLPQLQASLAGHVDCLMKTLDKAGLLDKRGRWEALETDDFGATALHLAARRNQIDCIRCLVKHAHVVESVRAQNGASSLHDAAATGSLECLRYLVGNSKNSVLDRDNNGSTPLHWAVQAGKMEAVVWLVEGAEAPLDARTNTGVTPVHFAAAKNHLKILQFLTGYEMTKTGELKTVHMQANNGATPLYFAAQEGNIECIRYLVKDGKSDPKTAASDGMRCVHAAAQEGHLACLKWLIVNAGQSAKQRSSDGATPGHFAATQGHIALLRWLLECTDATGEELDNYGATLAHDAAEQGQIGSLKYLHEQGISLNRLDDEGSTPLSLAQGGGHRECVEFLKRAVLEKREPRARISILEQVERSGYGMASGGIDTTDDELGASQDTIDGLTTSDEALLNDDGDEEVDGEAEEKRQARLNEMQEHAKQVALEKELERAAAGEQKRELEIEEGYALNIIKQANTLQAQIDAEAEKERSRIGKWKKSLPRGGSAEDFAASMLENGLDELPDELLQATALEQDEAEEEEDRDLTSAEKKQLRKAKKEKKKAENKDKNKTLKKIGQLMRRQSERGERERSASEPVSLDSSIPESGIGSMPGSETASLADESMISLQRKRGMSDGSVDINEVQTKAQAKGFVRKRKSMFETKQVDRDRKVKSFSRWMKKSGRSSLAPTPEAQIPEAPPAPPMEELLPSGAMSPTDSEILSPRRRSLATRLGFSLSNLATSMSSLLNIGSTSTSPRPSRSVSFSDLKSDGGSSSELTERRSSDDHMTSGIASMASTRSRHSSEADDDQDLQELGLRSPSGTMPSSLQSRLAEALKALDSSEQEEINRLYAMRTPKSSVDEAMFIAEVEEKAASRKSSREESAGHSAALSESHQANLDEALRMALGSGGERKKSASRRLSLEEALNVSTAAEQRERKESFGHEPAEKTTTPSQSERGKHRPPSLEDALKASGESGLMATSSSSARGGAAAAAIEDELMSVPGAPHLAEPMSPVRGSWSEEKFPGNSPGELLAAVELALAQNPSAPSAAREWLQSPRNRLSPPDDIHDSLMQMILAPRNMSASQLIAKLGTEQSIARPAGGTAPPPPPPNLPPPVFQFPPPVPPGMPGDTTGGDDTAAAAGGGDPGIPPPPPPMIPNLAELTNPQKEQVFLDPITEASELEEAEDEELMAELYELGRERLREVRQELLAMIEKEMAEREQQQRKDAAEKELIQQQIMEEQRRKSENHRQQQLALQGRNSRGEIVKSPIDGVVRRAQGGAHLRRMDTPRHLPAKPQAVEKLTKGPSRALIDALYRKAVLRRYMDAWLNHIRDRNLLILRLHAFMEKKARRLMLNCFMAWIEYRNTEMGQRRNEHKAVNHYRTQMLRKALEGWCTICGISGVSHARDYREKLNRQLQRNRDSLLAWINSHLPDSNQVTNLTSDLASGLRVAQMLQTVSGKQAPRLVARPRLPVQKLDNWRAIQGFMEQLGMGEQRQQLQGLVDGDEYWTQNILHTTQRWLAEGGR